MACSLSDAKLVFESSGMEIAPYEIDYRSARGKLDYAKAKVSRKAGLYISDNFYKYEPVRIEVDGHVIDRLMVPDSPVQVGHDYGWVTLVDQRNILNRGIIDKVFHKTTLGDVLEYIFEHIDDPNGVLKDTRFTDPDEADVTTEDYRIKYNFWFRSGYGAQQDEFYERIGFYSAVHDSMRFINEMTGLLGREGGFDFDQATPAEAIQQVEEEFSLDSWVDETGVLWLGIQDTRADFYLAGPGDDQLRIKSYNVVEDAHGVKSVIVSGAYNTTIWGDHYDGAVRGSQDKQLQSWAIAKWTEADGGRQISLDTKRVMKGEDLAALAATKLRSEIHDAKSGELVINPLASGHDTGHPAEIVVGDHIGVIGMIESDCRQEWESDLFTVNGISHRIGDEGWEVSLNVGKIVALDEIEVSFWYFDPTSGETYSPEELYDMQFTGTTGTAA